jgi:hypothetical protein
MTLDLVSLLYGFVAAAIAVLVVHQGIVFVLNQAGIWPAKPWSMAPIGPLGVPTIVNSVFWGGLWGVVYAAFNRFLPVGPVWQKGILFGLLMALVSNFLILPLIKGQPVFMGGDTRKIAIVLGILSGFGLATAYLYHGLRTLT